MDERRISHEDAQRLKALILSFAEGPAELHAVDLILCPVSGVVNCRVEVSSASTKQKLAERCMGVSVGKSVYFSLPWRGSDDGFGAESLMSGSWRRRH